MMSQIYELEQQKNIAGRLPEDNRSSFVDL